MDKYGNVVDVESVGKTGSEVELNQVKGGKKEERRDNGDWQGDGIQVKTDVDLRIEEVRMGIEAEIRKGGLSTNVSHWGFRGN